MSKNQPAQTPAPKGQIYRYSAEQIRIEALVIDPFTGSTGRIIQILQPRTEWDPDKKEYKIKRVLIRTHEEICVAVLVRIESRHTGCHHKLGDMVPWQIPVTYMPTIFLTPEQSAWRSYSLTLPESHAKSGKKSEPKGVIDRIRRTGRPSSSNKLSLILALVTASSLLLK